MEKAKFISNRRENKKVRRLGRRLSKARRVKERKILMRMFVVMRKGQRREGV
jgi:hypothetical protein